MIDKILKFLGLEKKSDYEIKYFEKRLIRLKAKKNLPAYALSENYPRVCRFRNDFRRFFKVTFKKATDFK